MFDDRKGKYMNTEEWFIDGSKLPSSLPRYEFNKLFKEAKAGIDSATDIEDAKNAYDQAAGIVGDAQKAYETAKAAYDSKVAEYNTALDELKAAQAA